MELIKVSLKDIHPYENNPRQNDGAVEAVMESIKQCSYVSPIVVDENMVILAGHTRYKALKKLRRQQCEVIVKEGLTEEQKRKYRILDNKTNEFALWDEELLADELLGLDFDGFDFGFIRRSFCQIAGLPEKVHIFQTVTNGSRPQRGIDQSVFAGVEKCLHTIVVAVCRIPQTPIHLFHIFEFVIA